MIGLTLRFSMGHTIPRKFVVVWTYVGISAFLNYSVTRPPARPQLLRRLLEKNRQCNMTQFQTVAKPVEVLSQTDNFLVINKTFDIKINSDNKAEVTIASILKDQLPDLVDESTCHGFRNYSVTRPPARPQLLRRLLEKNRQCNMTQFQTVAKPVEVLSQTDNFLVINKTFDIKINSDNKAEVTIASILKDQLPDLVDESTCHGFRFVHRLDHATSGILCLALKKCAAKWAGKAFETRSTKKHYLAIVRGHVDSTWSLGQDISIGVGQDSSVDDVYKMCTSDNSSCTRARDAQTKFVLLEHGQYDGQAASKLLLIPYTGRSHQLRVHCLHAGHPIVGDYTYSNRADNKPYRMMLHAYRLVVEMEKENVDITTTDPFTHEKDALWTPAKIFNTYESCVS